MSDWILAEDAALKEKLQGVVVSDSKNENREVGVWFGYPDKEVRDIRYPFITIDWVDLQRAQEREHRAMREYLPYVPRGFEPEEEEPILYSGYPLPFNLIYAVTTYCQVPQHDRQIQAQLAGKDRIPERFGYLDVAEGATTGTVRRIDRQAVTIADDLMGGKRLFRKIYRILVSTELFADQVIEVFGADFAETVGIDLKFKIPGDDSVHQFGVAIDS